MFGVNCAFTECNVCRCKLHEGTIILSIRKRKNEYYQEWRKEILRVFLKYQGTRVKSSGSTVSSLFFVCLIVCLFICFVFDCSLLLFPFLLLLQFCFVLLVLLLLGVFFQIFGGQGMGVEALIRKNTGVLRGSCDYNLCWPE